MPTDTFNKVTSCDSIPHVDLEKFKEEASSKLTIQKNYPISLKHVTSLPSLSDIIHIQSEKEEFLKKLNLNVTYFHAATIEESEETTLSGEKNKSS